MGLAKMKCPTCGHNEAARCARCGREMVCGSIAIPCPVKNCLEGILPDVDSDLKNGPIESPRTKHEN